MYMYSYIALNKVPCLPDALCTWCSLIVLGDCGGETRSYEIDCLITIDKRKDSSDNLHNKDDKHHNNVLHGNRSTNII